MRLRGRPSDYFVSITRHAYTHRIQWFYRRSTLGMSPFRLALNVCRRKARIQASPTTTKMDGMRRALTALSILLAVSHRATDTPTPHQPRTLREDGALVVEPKEIQ